MSSPSKGCSREASGDAGGPAPQGPATRGLYLWKAHLSVPHLRSAQVRERLLLLDNARGASEAAGGGCWCRKAL
eukprot:4722131-Pleurochrysis_carterae.AAC.2